MTVYKKIEIVGTSTESLEAAIQDAVNTASESVRKLRWFEVTEVRGSIGDDNALEYQVTVKIGFHIEGEELG
jgi:hypothetical protein